MNQYLYRVSCALVALLLAACGSEPTNKIGLQTPLLDSQTPKAEPEPAELDLAPTPDDSGPGVHISEEEAFEQDVAILARERGLPLARVRASMRFQVSFGAYAQDVVERFPGQVAAIWMVPMPATQGHIVFVGNAPGESDLARGKNISIRGGATLSIEEQRARVEMTTETMIAMGYRDHDTSYDHMTQRIQVAARPDSVGRIVDLDELTAEVSRRLIAGSTMRLAAAEMEATDIDLEAKVEDNMVNHSRGGNWLRDDGVRECTSGWTVTNNAGTVAGVVTAAHCNGLNQFEESTSSIYSMGFQSQGAAYVDGDAEWHTTSHSEVNEFYSSDTVTRTQGSWAFTSGMVGASVCHYGRSSNRRTCAHTILATDTCYFATNISATICKVAKTSSPNHTIIGGDSGGGWGWSTTVYGVHSGNNSSTSWFTPYEQFIGALNIWILW